MVKNQIEFSTLVVLVFFSPEDAQRARKLELLRMLEQEAERLKLLKTIADSNRKPITTSLLVAFTGCCVFVLGVWAP
jgi:hypothetical protein